MQKLQENRESFGFSGSKDEERVNEKDSNRKTPLRVKSNEEVFKMIQTHEILSESDCSEIEENKAEFVTTIMDLFDIYNEDGDGNCLFRAISRLTYGTPDHHKEIRETVCDYIATRYDRFSNFILWDINDYIDKMLDEGTWGGEPEVVAFSELYNVTVNIYERFTSQTPDNRYVAGINAPEINLFYRNGNHYDSLFMRNTNQNVRPYKRIKKKEYLNWSLTKIEKSNKNKYFRGDYATVYSNQTISGIFDYLLNGKYPKEITDIENVKKRDGRKRNFREMVAKDKKYKTEKKNYWWKRSDCFIKKQSL